jgi:hypothetical protein
MNEFLYSKFLSFTPTAVGSFVDTLTDNMPKGISDHSFIAGDTRIWGFDGDNFWWCSNGEARYHETNGTIHVFSISKDQSYFDNCNILYNIGKSENKTFMSQLSDFTTMTMPNVPSHPVSPGKNLYYLKYNTSNGMYGTMPKMIFLTGTDDTSLVSYVKSLIDSLTWIFTSLSELGYTKFPNLAASKDKIITNNGLEFFVFPEFTLSKQDCLSEHLAHLELIIELKPNITTSSDVQELNTLLSIARNTWTNLLSN